MKPTRPKAKKRCRSAKTGEYVSAGYAAENPDTTVTETEKTNTNTPKHEQS